MNDIRDLGLFNGKNNEWDFYISYNDMILLGMEDEINKSIIQPELVKYKFYLQDKKMKFF